MSRIPFESPDFGWEDLEKFMVRFLNAGISLLADYGDESAERRILTAVSYGKKGDKQKGIDIRAKVEGGEIWCFQCKLFTRGRDDRLTLFECEKIVSETEYVADKYFLVAVARRDVHPDAVDYIDSKEGWDLWDSDVLSSQFLARVRPQDSVMILEEFFDSRTVAQILGSLRSSQLVSADEYFKSSTREKSAFNHLTRLVGEGRRELVDALHRFVADSEKTVMLVSARGGEGKSRCLKEFADEFESKHPKRTLRFVSHLAADDGTSEMIIQPGEFVVVHEDGHRVETLRPALLAAMAQRDGAKLVLTLRPQGFEAVREALRKVGLEFDDCEVCPAVSPLKRSEMVELAREVLGKSRAMEPHTLAEWSDRSPLICVVGGNLIREAALRPHEFRDSKAFQEEVFHRFETQNLESLCERSVERRDILKRLLRVLAMLAPYPDDRAARKTLAGFFRLPVDECMKRLDELLASELVNLTYHGWRVGPDLFADHLVYVSCLRDSLASPLCEEVIDAFGANHFPALLRNLSEAEWRCRATKNAQVDLTGPLWESFKKKFEASSFYDRREMLETWVGFSVFLPEKSLELANLAIDQTTAPRMEGLSTFGDWENSLDTHRRVIAMLPAVLKPVGIFHEDRRFEVFDLLGQLGVDWESEPSVGSHNEDNHPWTKIAAAASFSLEQPMDSVNGVIAWLGSRIGVGKVNTLIDWPSSFLSVVLRPIFDKAINRTYSEGMNVVFQTIPLSYEKTVLHRERAFSLIEKAIVPRSENACMNVIPVLKHAASSDGGLFNAKIDLGKWRPARIQALKLLGLCAESWDSPFVRFQVWRSCATGIPYEKDCDIAATLRDVLRGVRRDRELSLALAVLGEDHEGLLEEDLGVEPDYHKRSENWTNFCAELAESILKAFESDADLLKYLEAFDEDAKKRNFSPNWWALIVAMCKTNEARIARIVEMLLSGRSSFLCNHFNSFVHHLPSVSDDQRDEWLARALDGAGDEIRRSILVGIQWLDDAPMRETSKALHKATSGDGGGELRAMSTIALVEALLRGRAWPMRFLREVSFKEIDEDTFAAILGKISKALRYGRLEIEREFVTKLIERLAAVDEIRRDPHETFIKTAAGIAPIEIFEFLRRRIEHVESLSESEREQASPPIPYDLEPWKIEGFSGEPGFDEAVGFLAAKMKCGDRKLANLWKSLFVAAVMMNDSGKGASALTQWLREADEVESFLRITDALNSRGCGFVFTEFELVKEILEKARMLGVSEYKRVCASLLPEPSHRGYKNGVPDDSSRWVLENAREAAAAHADDETLLEFYESIVDREVRDQEFHKERYQNDLLAMA